VTDQASQGGYYIGAFPPSFLYVFLSLDSTHTHFSQYTFILDIFFVEYYYSSVSAAGDTYRTLQQHMFYPSIIET
jgi:hypothetical protein